MVPRIQFILSIVVRQLLLLLQSTKVLSCIFQFENNRNDNRKYNRDVLYTANQSSAFCWTALLLFSPTGPAHQSAECRHGDGDGALVTE